MLSPSREVVDPGSDGTARVAWCQPTVLGALQAVPFPRPVDLTAEAARMKAERTSEVGEHEVPRSQGSQSAGLIKHLLSDIEPFFYGRPVIYVDAGAHKGDVFREVYESSLNIRWAHLIEPNPASFAALEAKVREIGAEAVTTCHNVALGAAPQRLRLRDADTMSRVVGDASRPAATSEERSFEVEATTLDTLAQTFPFPHMSILKIDVEGYERELLAGATELLGAQRVDLIYVEAGIDPANVQQTYYRDIEDLLGVHSYRLFRIYEQKNEWLEDSPFLRRANLAFLSKAFASKNPYQLSRKLMTVQRDCQALRGQVKALERTAATASGAVQERDRTVAALREEAVSLRRERESLVADLEAVREEEAARKVEADRLVAELGASQARMAAQDETIEALRIRQVGVEQDLSNLRRHSAELERRLRDVLASTTWRAIAPMRRVMHLIRGLGPLNDTVPTLTDVVGTRSPAPGTVAPGGPVASPILTDRGAAKLFASPKAVTPTKKALAAMHAKEERPLSERAQNLMHLSSQGDTRGLLAAEQDPEGEPDGTEAFFLSRFATLLAHYRFSSYTKVVEAIDAIGDRVGFDLLWIERHAGTRVFLRFVVLAASSLSRVQRHDEARRLIDGAIERHPGRTELLRARAQICWPYDPDQARADLGRSAEQAPLPSDWELLRVYLDLMAGSPKAEAAMQADWAGNRQMPLVFATAALGRGDFASYRRGMNAFFELQGLAAPIPDGADAFGFSNLRCTGGSAPAAPGPRVSVVMTTYNSAESVGYAARSILSQTHRNLELFIVDDCSVDDTRQIVADLERSDGRVRVLHNGANVGTYLSKNRAMERTSGEYVTFHDSDDWAHPERLARHLRLMEENRGLVVSRSEWLRVGSDGQIRLHRWSHKFQHANPASMFVRREVIEAVGYYDSVRFGADTEYWYRILRRFGNECAATLPLCLSLGALHDASLTQSGDGAMGLENYAPVRGAYAASYMRWQAAASPEALRRPPAPTDRAFWAPPEMLATMANDEAA